MAEYVNKEQLDRKFIIEMLSPSTTTIFDAKNIIDGLPTADVIERVEYDKLLEENKQLKCIISDKVDEDLKCAFEIKELRSKIDNALADMQSMLDQEVLNDNVISDVGQGIAIAMGLLKENIGE